MSKPYFNPKLSPGISKANQLLENTTPKVVYHNPLKESVGRLEEQNLEALQSLSQLNHVINELVELNHMENKKIDQLSKMQGVLLEEQTAAERDRDDQFDLLQSHQEDVKHQQHDLNMSLQTLLQEVSTEIEQVKGLKEAFISEEFGKRLTELAELIQSFKKDQKEETKSVLEANALQNLLLEEMARRQVELDKGQKNGFKKVLEKLNLIKSDHDKQHDTQLENQKLMVDSLYKLLHEEQFLEELKLLPKA